MGQAACFRGSCGGRDDSARGKGRAACASCRALRRLAAVLGAGSAAAAGAVHCEICRLRLVPSAAAATGAAAAVWGDAHRPLRCCLRLLRAHARARGPGAVSAAAAATAAADDGHGAHRRAAADAAAAAAATGGADGVGVPSWGWCPGHDDGGSSRTCPVGCACPSAPAPAPLHLRPAVISGRWGCCRSDATRCCRRCASYADITRRRERPVRQACVRPAAPAPAAAALAQWGRQLARGHHASAAAGSACSGVLLAVSARHRRVHVTQPHAAAATAAARAQRQQQRRGCQWCPPTAAVHHTPRRCRGRR